MHETRTVPSPGRWTLSRVNKSRHAPRRLCPTEAVRVQRDFSRSSTHLPLSSHNLPPSLSSFLLLKNGNERLSRIQGDDTSLPVSCSRRNPFLPERVKFFSLRDFFLFTFLFLGYWKEWQVTLSNCSRAQICLWKVEIFVFFYARKAQIYWSSSESSLRKHNLSIDLGILAGIFTTFQPSKKADRVDVTLSAGSVVTAGSWEQCYRLLWEEIRTTNHCFALQKQSAWKERRAREENDKTKQKWHKNKTLLSKWFDWE